MRPAVFESAGRLRASVSLWQIRFAYLAPGASFSAFSVAAFTVRTESPGL